MTEFWEANFNEKQEMWGFEPATSARIAIDFFVKESIKNILIPGIGYGRNAQLFKEKGIKVTGIEISKTAIILARKKFGTDMALYYGSVNDMPFDKKQYDGIFCHALIHLLDHEERIKLIQNCYHQLAENGCMIFTAIQKKAPNFGKGTLLSKDRYEFHKGVKIFYYNIETVQREFAEAGLFEITEVAENQPLFLIKCRKKTSNY